LIEEVSIVTDELVLFGYVGSVQYTQPIENLLPESLKSPFQTGLVVIEVCYDLLDRFSCLARGAVRFLGMINAAGCDVETERIDSTKERFSLMVKTATLLGKERAETSDAAGPIPEGEEASPQWVFNSIS
jgi:hypothetical protein